MGTDTLRQKVERMMGQPHRLTSLERQAVIAAYRLGERKPLTTIHESTEGKTLFIYSEETPNGLIITERSAMGIVTYNHRSLRCCGHYSWASCEASYDTSYFLYSWRTHGMRIICCNINH